MQSSHIIITFAVLVIVGIAEWLHARRVARVARLAFGPSGRASRWTIVVAPSRTIAAALATWGLMFLVTYDPIEIDRKPAKIASNHLLVLIDVGWIKLPKYGFQSSNAIVLPAIVLGHALHRAHANLQPFR